MGIQNPPPDMPPNMDDFMRQLGQLPKNEDSNKDIKNPDRFEGINESTKPTEREGIVSKPQGSAQVFSSEDLENIEPGLSKKSPLEVLKALAKKKGYPNDVRDLPIKKASSEIEKIGVRFGDDEKIGSQENLYKSGDYHLKTKTIQGKECYIANVNFEIELNGRVIRWTQEVQTKVEVPKSKSKQEASQKRAFMLINCYKDLHFEDPINTTFQQKPGYTTNRRTLSDRKLQQMSLSNIKFQVNYKKRAGSQAPIKSIYLQDDLKSTRRFQKMTKWKPKRPRHKFSNAFSARLNFIKSPQMGRLYNRHETLRLDAKQASKDFKNFALGERAKAMNLYEKSGQVQEDVDNLKNQITAYQEQLESLDEGPEKNRLEGQLTETKALLKEEEAKLDKYTSNITQIDTQLQFIGLIKKSRKNQMMSSIDQSETGNKSQDIGGLNKADQEKFNKLKKLIDGYDQSPILDAYRNLSTPGSSHSQFERVFTSIDQKIESSRENKENISQELGDLKLALEQAQEDIKTANPRDQGELRQQIEEHEMNIDKLTKELNNLETTITQLDTQKEYSQLLQRQQNIKNKIDTKNLSHEELQAKDLSADMQQRLADLKEEIDSFPDNDILRDVKGLKSGSPYTEFKRISAQIKIEMSVFDRINRAASVFDKDHSYLAFADSKIHVTREKSEDIDLELGSSGEDIDLGFDVETDDITKDIYNIQEGFGVDIFDDIIPLPQSSFSTIKKFPKKDIEPISAELSNLINKAPSVLESLVAKAYSNAASPEDTLSEEDRLESDQVINAFKEGYDYLISGQASDEESKQLIEFLKVCASTFDFESEYSLAGILNEAPKEQTVDHLINWVALGGTMESTGEMGLEFGEFLTLNTTLTAGTIETLTRQALSHQSSRAFIRLSQDRAHVNDEESLEIGLNLKDDKGYTALQRMICETPTDQMHLISTLINYNPNLAALSNDNKSAIDYLIERAQIDTSNDNRMMFDDLISTILEETPPSDLYDNTSELNKLRDYFNERQKPNEEPPEI